MRVTVSKARETFAELLNEVCYGGWRVIITKRGRERAALVPIADLEKLIAIDLEKRNK